MKPFVFVSCGQFTPAEKELGKRVAQLVADTTPYDPFFAENQQDLDGLKENIFKALCDCAGFICIMHPRGNIETPEGLIVRGSVWIEQEIAIAAYAQMVEERRIRIAVFVHQDIAREGLRQLLILNPVSFRDDGEVLVALSDVLKAWTDLTPGGKAVPRVVLKAARESDTDAYALKAGFVNGDKALAEFRFDLNFPFEFYVPQSSNAHKRSKGALEGHYCLYVDDKVLRTGRVYPGDDLSSILTLRFRVDPSKSDDLDKVVLAQLYSEDEKYEKSTTIRNLLDM